MSITFTPLALETLRGWHPVALATINRLGSQLAKNVGKEEVDLHSPPETALLFAMHCICKGYHEHAAVLQWNNTASSKK